MKLSSTPEPVDVDADTAYSDPVTLIGSTWVGALIERLSGTGAVTVTVQGAIRPTATSEGADEQQTITLTDTTGGDFTLDYAASGPTAAIAWDATKQDVEDALVAGTSINLGEIQVDGVDGGPWTVSFIGALAATGVDELVIDDTGLTGAGGESGAVATTVAGGVPIAEWVDTPLTLAGHNTDAPGQLLGAASVDHIFAVWPHWRFKVVSAGTAQVRCILVGS